MIFACYKQRKIFCEVNWKKRRQGIEYRQCEIVSFFLPFLLECVTKQGIISAGVNVECYVKENRYEDGHWRQ